MCRHMYNWNIVDCDVIQPKMNLNQKFTSLAKIGFKYIEFVENAQNEESAIYFLGITFHLFKYIVWLRITDEGSVPEMRIWSIL